jgi:hypothetical protein
MEHLDEDRLVVIALHEEPVDAETVSHLETCEICRTELDEMLRVVSAAQFEYDETTDLTAPPEHVWSAITAAVSGDQTVVPLTWDRPTGEPGAQGRRGPRAPTWLAVAAGVVIGAAGAAAAVWVSGWGEPSESVLATASLDPFGETGTSGQAEVRETDDGRVLDVEIVDRTPGGGFREVWLLDPETGNLVSLGVLNGQAAEFILPDGLDLADYPTVDVSREPFDGDPAHSTDSIARGNLEI